MAPIIPIPRNQIVDLPYSEFRAARSLGRASLLLDVATAAATKICGLYGKSPSTVVKLIPFGPGLIDNSKGLFDDLCEDIAPPPDPPVSPFNGGQCENTRYQVDISARLRGPAINGVFPEPRNETFSDLVWGKINSIQVAGFAQRQSGPFTYEGYSRIEASAKGNGGVPSSQPFTFTVVGSSQNEIQSINSVSITKFGGGADTCGNPPISYPPPSATPNDLDGTTNITIAPNTTISVPIKIVPTFSPIVGIFKPEFNVDVGGINVNMSLGGFTFSPTVNLVPNETYPYSDPRSVKPDARPIDQFDDAGCPDVDLQPVIDEIRKISPTASDDCCPTPAKDDDPDFINKSVSSVELESGSVTLPEGAYKVRLLTTVIAPKSRIQFGGTQADVIYGGWSWFGSSFSLGVRNPIDAIDKQFIPPNKDQNSFVFTGQVGSKAIVTVYYKEKR